MTKRKPARELRDRDLFKRAFHKPVRDKIAEEKAKVAKPKKKGGSRHDSD